MNGLTQMKVEQFRAACREAIEAGAPVVFEPEYDGPGTLKVLTGFDWTGLVPPANVRFVARFVLSPEGEPAFTFEAIRQRARQLEGTPMLWHEDGHIILFERERR